MSPDLLIIGAGPAGMAAAAEAAQHGATATVLDEQSAPGGQIYRAIRQADHTRKAILGLDYAAGHSLTQGLEHNSITHVSDAIVWAIEPDGTVFYSVAGRPRKAFGRRLVLATGALERPTPMPGWCLPGVTTAGAAQILMKTAGIVASNAVLAGCGPLLYLVAVQMISAGTPPKALVETQTYGELARAMPHLSKAWSNTGLLLKGWRMLRTIRRAGVPRYTGATSLRIEGEKRAEALCFHRGSTPVRLECDHVFLHAGVVPNCQITRAIGADHVWDSGQVCFRPVVDKWGETSVAGIYVAGDGAGIVGSKGAEHAGRIAALGALSSIGGTSDASFVEAAAPHFRILAGERAFRPFLEVAYPPAPQFTCPSNETIICRCEEVSASDIRQYAQLGCRGPNQAKAFGRVGMGPCQGRYCGLSVTMILADENGQPPDYTGYFRVRAPYKPVSLGELAQMDGNNKGDCMPEHHGRRSGTGQVPASRRERSREQGRQAGSVLRP